MRLEPILAGADALMIASTLLRQGPGFLRTMLDELGTWLEEHECHWVEQVKGSLDHGHCPNPARYERLNDMRALTSFSS